MTNLKELLSFFGPELINSDTFGFDSTKFSDILDTIKLGDRPTAELTISPATKGNKMNFMQNMGADKFMERMFRKADGVVWDLMTGKVGIKTKDGSIATLAGQGDDAQVEINLMDQFGLEIPAFAQNTPIASVNVGDVIFFGVSEKPGWVVERRYGVKPVGSSTPAAAKAKRGAVVDNTTIDPTTIDTSNVQFTLMKVDGQRTTWKPPKVTMLGMGDNGVMVLRSLMSMLPGGQAGLQGMQNMIMPMLMMGGEMDFEKLMPIMLMGGMQTTTVTNSDGTVVAQNPMSQMLPMLMMMNMMKGDKSPFNGSGSKNGGGNPFNR